MGFEGSKDLRVKGLGSRVLWGLSQWLEFVESVIQVLYLTLLKGFLEIKTLNPKPCDLNPKPQSLLCVGFVSGR